jgi:hypothetical protein
VTLLGSYLSTSIYLYLFIRYPYLILYRWKGENVSTAEVALAVSACPGVNDVNVYGVSIPNCDGRAGIS